MKKKERIIGFRSNELDRRLRALLAANKGRVSRSDLLRAAVEEKLDRIQNGTDQGIVLRMPRET